MLKRKIGKIPDRLLCYVGVHRFVKKNHSKYMSFRVCKYCGLEQFGEYDMTYGEIVWMNIKTEQKEKNDE